MGACPPPAAPRHPTLTSSTAGRAKEAAPRSEPSTGSSWGADGPGPSSMHMSSRMGWQRGREVAGGGVAGHNERLLRLLRDCGRPGCNQV